MPPRSIITSVLLQDYIRSERFIHDDLCNRVQGAVDKLYELWKRQGKIYPSLLTWPAESVQGNDGLRIDNVCVMDLPEEAGERTRAIRELVARTKAYALFLVEQKSEEVRAVLESGHGTRSWRLPIVRHGDVSTLGRPTMHDDVDSLGLLWRPKMGQPS